MESRRKRKRGRRSKRARANAGLRGDWANASRSDLVLLRTAIHNGWPIPDSHKGPLLEAIRPLLETSDERLGLAVVKVFLAASEANVKQLESQS